MASGPDRGTDSPRRGRPVDRRQYGSLTLSAENGELVAEDDDFQLFEAVRPHPQGRELEKATQHQVAERDKHDASCVPNWLGSCLLYSGSDEMNRI
jgi:hypothetical protein